MAEEDAARVRVFPPGVPLVAILLAVGMNRLWPLDLGVGVSAPLRYWLGGAIVAGAVLGLGLWSVVLFRRGGQSENPWKPTPAIEESGPFRFTRNPMYLQMVLICIGLSVVLMNWWLLALTPVVMWLLQRLAIEPEEAYLERKFGAVYLAYKRKVRRWI
jgi:protein-S-isoprenylcysteine O-methyltransferase Ste14